MDKNVDPCADFFEFSCGQWLRDNEIPEELSSYGTIDGLAQQVDLALKGE